MDTDTNTGVSPVMDSALAGLESVFDFGVDRLDEIVYLFQHTWWTKDRSPAQIAASVAATSVTVGLHCPVRDRLVGFTRAFSDGVYKALVMDVVVETDLRRNRIGHLLMETLLSHPLVAAVEDVELYCNVAREAFYSDFGFSVPDELLFMRRTRTTLP